MATKKGTKTASVSKKAGGRGQQSGTGGRTGGGGSKRKTPKG
jgi:hypothetical protein